MIKFFLLFCFIVFPLIEIYLFFLFSSFFGFLICFSEVVFTGFLGIYLIRKKYFSIFKNFSVFNNDLSKISVINEKTNNLIFSFLGSMLLFFPGIATDVFGLLILLLPVKPLTSFFLSKFIYNQSTFNRNDFNFRENNDVFEGEYYDITKDENVLSNNKKTIK